MGASCCAEKTYYAEDHPYLTLEEGTVSLAQPCIPRHGFPNNFSPIERTFNRIDFDVRGYLDKAELLSFCSQCYEAEKAKQVQKHLLHLCDVNQDGKVYVDEWKSSFDNMVSHESVELLSLFEDLAQARRRKRIGLLYRKMDTDGKGLLDKMELIRLCFEGQPNPRAALRLQASCDSDKNGKITIEDWQAMFQRQAERSDGTMAEMLLLFDDLSSKMLEQRMEMLFRRIDIDASGSLNKVDLMRFCKAGSVNMTGAEDLLGKCDTHKNGKISMGEWKAMFHREVARSDKDMVNMVLCFEELAPALMEKIIEERRGVEPMLSARSTSSLSTTTSDLISPRRKSMRKSDSWASDAPNTSDFNSPRRKSMRKSDGCASVVPKDLVGSSSRSSAARSSAGVRDSPPDSPSLSSPSQISTDWAADFAVAPQDLRAGVSAIQNDRSSTIIGHVTINSTCLRASGLVADDGTSCQLSSRVSAYHFRLAGFDFQQLRLQGFDAKDLRLRGFDALELRKAGYDALELKAAGFSLSELQLSGFDDEELLAAGFDYALSPRVRFRTPGLNVQALKAAGADFEALKADGFDLEAMEGAAADEEVVRAVVSKLRDAGFSAKQLKDFGIDARHLRHAGFDAEILMAAKFTFKDLKSGGFAPQELRAAGVQAGELKAVGFTAQDLKAAGFELVALRAAGFSAEEVGTRRLTRNLWKLKAAGFTIEELKQAGFTFEQMVLVGFDPKELHAFGFNYDHLSAGDLKAAGSDGIGMKTAVYNFAKIEAAGKSGLDKRLVGMTAVDLKAEGYPAEDLFAAGFTFQNLAVAGYDEQQMQDGLQKFLLETPREHWNDVCRDIKGGSQTYHKD